MEDSNTDRKKIVVVGNGMVSWRFCSSLVKTGGLANYDVTVIGEEPRPAYDRVHLTDYFEDKNPESLELASRQWYADEGIVLHTGDAVVTVDRKQQQVHTQGGEEFSYDRLVMATGSYPFVPPIEGVKHPAVFVYRTIEDVQAIEAYAQGCRSAAVIGGGLLGLEAADVVRKMNLRTHVIEAANGLMPRQLNQEGAEVLHAELAVLGLTLHLKKITEKVAPQGEGIRLSFRDGEALDVDMLIVSAGIRPRSELAEEAGLSCAARGGILIGDNLRTGDAKVYAIGECASHRGMIYGLVGPGYQMADALVGRLTGGEDLFEGSDLSCRLKLLGVDVANFGDFDGSYDQYSFRDKGVYRMLNVHEGKLVGATMVGAWEQATAIEQAVRNQVRVAAGDIRKFMGSGELPGLGATDSVLSWPSTAVVCNCTNTTCGQLKLAMGQGCSTIDCLEEKTGAGSVCGSCKPLLAQMVGADAQDISDQIQTRGVKPLWYSGILAGIVSLVFLLYPGLPVADTVQSAYYQLTQLWENRLPKQITGFSLLGISVLSVLISLRKRVKRFKVGHYGLWRAIHSILGLVTLLFLFLHTGFRGGENLNLWLFLTFVALNTAGAVAALTVAKDSPSLWGRRLRAWSIKFHIIFFWPYPVLLGFHIAKTFNY